LIDFFADGLNKNLDEGKEENPLSGKLEYDVKSNPPAAITTLYVIQVIILIC